MKNLINRREFVAGSVALGCFPYASLRAAVEREYILAPEYGEHSAGIGIIDLNTDKAYHIPVQQRGHVMILTSDIPDIAVMAAQRPGKISYVIDLKQKKMVKQFTSSKGYHFYGHGIFMNKGTELWMTENNDQTAKGKVVKRSFPRLEIIGEFPTEGFAPHELKLLEGGKKLVIANGGTTDIEVIQNTTVYRKDLIQSTVSYFDVEKESLISDTSCPYKNLSIRHLDVHLPSNTVITTIKEYDSSNKKTYSPLLYQTAGGPLKAFYAPEDEIQKMNSFCLSVTVNEPMNQVGSTAPNSDLVAFWDLKEKKLIKTIKMHSPNGICHAKDGNIWIVASSTGEVAFIDAKTLKPLRAYEGKYQGFNAFHCVNSRSFGA